MLKPLATRFLQHLCAQNAWAKSQLQAHAGKVIRVQLGPVSNNLAIIEDGSLAMSGKTATPDATMQISLGLGLRLLAQDTAAKTEITLEGDTHLAADFGKMLQHMRWDFEDDAAKIIGDIPATKITETARKTVEAAKNQAKNAAEMLAEFWQEEKPILTKKLHVETFNQQVDILAADTARLEKKLEKLQEKLKKPLS